VAKWVRISPRKARVVVQHIRGRSVPEARTVLAFTQRAAAREIEKVLRSAVANAEANHDLIGDELVVAAAFVDDGVTIKRGRPRARGRYAQILKRTCHITVELASPPDRPVPSLSAKAASPPKRRSPRAEPSTAAARAPEAKPKVAPEVEEKPKPKPKPKRTSRARKPAEPKEGQ